MKIDTWSELKPEILHIISTQLNSYDVDSYNYIQTLTEISAELYHLFEKFKSKFYTNEDGVDVNEAIRYAKEKAIIIKGIQELQTIPHYRDYEVAKKEFIDRLYNMTVTD